MMGETGFLLGYGGICALMGVWVGRLLEIKKNRGVAPTNQEQRPALRLVLADNYRGQKVGILLRNVLWVESDFLSGTRVVLLHMADGKSVPLPEKMGGDFSWWVNALKEQ
jgi:hypothetical protein